MRISSTESKPAGTASRDRATSRRPIGILLACAVAASVLRITVFSEGGNLGAYAMTVVFWLSVLALFAMLARRDIALRRAGAGFPVLKWVLMVLALLAFAIGGLLEDDVTETITSVVFVACVAGIVVMLVARRARRAPSRGSSAASEL